MTQSKVALDVSTHASVPQHEVFLCSTGLSASALVPQQVAQGGTDLCIVQQSVSFCKRLSYCCSADTRQTSGSTDNSQTPRLPQLMQPRQTCCTLTCGQVRLAAHKEEMLCLIAYACNDCELYELMSSLASLHCLPQWLLRVLDLSVWALHTNVLTLLCMGG